MNEKKLKISDPIKLRALQFAKSQKLIMGDFYEKISSDPSNFSGKGLESSLSGDKIVGILTSYPELSADWLLLEKGEMLRKNSAKNVAVAYAPQSHACNGEMKFEAPAELLSLVTSQQETIKKLTDIISSISKNE